MFVVRKSTYERETERLSEELQRVKQELAVKESEFNRLLATTSRERQKHNAYRQRVSQKDAYLARQALDLIECSPAFPSTDPSRPMFSWTQVEQGARRLRQELAEQ